jgi:hypothetical protein
MNSNAEQAISTCKGHFRRKITGIGRIPPST